ncbi:MAG: ACP S-malonyltransferase [Firmicutes bacterium]|nr:ACP S-malonyltransferase [Bacillota bacterium]
MRKTAVLFAGQGSQSPGMGLDFYEKYESFRQVFDLLPEKQRRIAFEGPAETLKDTRNTQPCMVAFAAGVWAVLKERLGEDIKPAMAAGLSLGEYSALCASGVFSPAEAIRLVTLRAEAMYQASLGVDCGMTAVIQLERQALAECCQQASDVGLVQIANYNCPGQIVIAGEKAAVDKAAELAMEQGARRCLPLAVSGPFHTRFMEPAGRRLAEAFAEAEFGDMAFPVAFNAVGRPSKDGERVAELLVKQVQSSVYFEDSLKYMTSIDVDTFVEVGPGNALSAFVKKTCPGAKVYGISKISDLEELPWSK